MKRNNIILLVVVGVMLAVVVNSFNNGETDEAYIKALTEHRRKKNIDFQTADDSPFANDFSKFDGLKYYAPDLKFKVRAEFIDIEDKKIITLSTSDALHKQYLEYGYVAFEIDNEMYRLVILEMVGDDFDGSLFLAFGDGTSAIDTYGAGRYLEVEHDGGSFMTLDFNYAYNPYCAYSEDFSCPFPPKENLLMVAIEAGEKNFE
ncbi:MAG: DUF1684 domain-containing protein [Cyclobacteriaceae bacterium]|nr:DUF1684 domain-containing protein [Cyclobacteriaceae bacterium]